MKWMCWALKAKQKNPEAFKKIFQFLKNVFLWLFVIQQELTIVCVFFKITIHSNIPRAYHLASSYNIKVIFSPSMFTECIDGQFFYGTNV